MLICLLLQTFILSTGVPFFIINTRLSPLQQLWSQFSICVDWSILDTKILIMHTWAFSCSSWGSVSFQSFLCPLMLLLPILPVQHWFPAPSIHQLMNHHVGECKSLITQLLVIILTKAPAHFHFVIVSISWDVQGSPIQVNLSKLSIQGPFWIQDLIFHFLATPIIIRD